jgi:hypothetical protein
MAGSHQVISQEREVPNVRCATDSHEGGRFEGS